MFSSIRQTRHLLSFFQKHLAMVNCCIFIFSVFLAMTYVVQVNSSATNGYRLRDLENSINQLTLDNQNLQIKLAEIRSVENVSSKVPMLGLVKAKTSPIFLSNQAPTVSLNR
jgi:hypothetical protein